MVKSYSLEEILEHSKIDLVDSYRIKLEKELEDYDMILIKIKNNISSYDIRIRNIESKGENVTIAEKKSLELMAVHLEGMVKKFEYLISLRQSKINNFNDNIMKR